MRDTLTEESSLDESSWDSVHEGMPHLSRAAFEDFLAVASHDGTAYSDFDDGPMPVPAGTVVDVRMVADPTAEQTLVFTRVGFDRGFRDAVVGSSQVCSCDENFECRENAAFGWCGSSFVHGLTWDQDHWREMGRIVHEIIN